MRKILSSLLQPVLRFITSYFTDCIYTFVKQIFKEYLKWRTVAILLSISLGSPLFAFAQPDTTGEPGVFGKLTAGFETHGFLKSEVAYRFRDKATFTKILNIYQLTSTYPISEDALFTVIGRVFYDPIYDLIALDDIAIPKEQLDVDFGRASVRNRGIILKEAYLSIFFDNVDLKLGKQIVRWGELEGFDISDIINPLDFAEYIFRDVEDRYIPLWMLKADYYLGDVTNEFIWIPDLKFHEPAQTGTEFEEFRLPPGLARPALVLRNTEFAYRGKLTIGETVVTAGYIYVWGDFPSAFRSVFGFGNTLTDVDFLPRYTRQRTFFGSFNRSLGNFVLSGEAGYNTGKFFGTAPEIDESIKGNELERDHLKYGLAISLVLYQADIILQAVQDEIFNYDEKIIQDKREYAGSLFIRRKFMYNRLIFQCLVLYLANHNEALYRPRADYKLREQLTLSVGMDIFDGDSGDLGVENFQFIGFFNQHDRIYTELKYNF